MTNGTQQAVLFTTTPLRGWRALVMTLDGRYRSLFHPDTSWKVGVWQRLPSIATPEEWHTHEHHRLILCPVTTPGRRWVLEFVPDSCGNDVGPSPCQQFSPLYMGASTGYLYRSVSCLPAEQVHPGFFAYRERDDLLKASGDAYVTTFGCRSSEWSIAPVEMRGMVHEYAKGYRAQEMRVLPPIEAFPRLPGHVVWPLVTPTVSFTEP